MSATVTEGFVRVASLSDVVETPGYTVHVGGESIALFMADGRVYAVDNRCPHMGYPLSRGSVKDCILTCHWHHARFDLTTGGTFDQWADDVRAFPAEVRAGEVWVDLTPRTDLKDHYRARLTDGLERDISLVIGKSVLYLLGAGVEPTEPFGIGLDFGTRYRRNGWGQGLTIHTCMMNMLPYLDAEDRPRALYHGLSAVARDSSGSAPRFVVRPLPSTEQSVETLTRWFRRFIEVRDDEGAERCVVSALRAGASAEQMADMLFSAATDHRYLQTGHVLDFINKAFEALDIAGWEQAEGTLTSLVMGLANAERMEESNAWRNPIDLVDILERTFDRLPEGFAWQADGTAAARLREQLTPTLLGDDPQATTDRLLNELQQGSAPQDLAGAVAYAAALRIARFHTNNEFGDWDRALHTFTFANAVHQGLRRTNSPGLARGLFDAAMSVYLDRFLNIPPARIPTDAAELGADIGAELASLLDKQQQVNEAGALVAAYLGAGRTDGQLLAGIGKALLREDRDFHTIQTVEAAFRLYAYLRGTEAGTHVLIAAARYLAAHSPTVRAQGQTYEIARRLHRGDHLFDE
jgi:nitrite reductase/ring-hydroxylating ferredoxin subunit